MIDPNEIPEPTDLVLLNADLALSRRYLSAFCAEDHPALATLNIEIHRSGRALSVLAAVAVQCTDFARVLEEAGLLGGTAQQWLDEAAFRQIETAAMEDGQQDDDG